MKVVTVALLCLSVAACWAIPRLSVKSALLAQERSLVVDAIMTVIENARQDMIANGYEPLKLDEFHYDLAELELENIFEGIISAVDLTIQGLTTFRIENMNYAVLSSTVTFNVYVDVLEACMGHFELKEGIVDGDEVSGHGHGNVKVFDAHIDARVRVSVGIISGVSVTGVSTQFDIGDIVVDAVAEELHGAGDLHVNEFIAGKAMHIVKNYPDEISAAINKIAFELLDNMF